MGFGLRKQIGRWLDAKAGLSKWVASLHQDMQTILGLMVNG